MDVSSFLKEVRTCSLPNIPVVLIGNKCDRLESRVVTFERAKVREIKSQLESTHIR